MVTVPALAVVFTCGFVITITAVMASDITATVLPALFALIAVAVVLLWSL